MMSFDRAVNRLRCLAAIAAAQDAIIDGSDEDVVAELVVPLLNLICGSTQHEALMALVLVLAEVIKVTEPDMRPLLVLAVMDILAGVVAEK